MVTRQSPAQAEEGDVMLWRRKALGWSLLALIFVWPLALWGVDEGIRGSKAPIARLDVQPARIDWLPQVDYESLVLTVAGPGDTYIQQELKAGQPPSLSVFRANGEPLPDGTYTYELRTKAFQKEGDSLVQSGFLTVRDGTFVEAPAASPGDVPSASKPQLRSMTAKDHQSLIVHGPACIGANCTSASGENLTVHSDAPFIVFDGGGQLSPNHDWVLVANDLHGGGEYFALVDATAGTVPFRIEGGVPGGAPGAPDHALYVRNNGNVGLETSTPGAKLHLFGSATSDVFGSAGPNPVSGPAFNFGYGGASWGRGAGVLSVRPDASATAPNPSLRFLTADVQRMIITNTGNVGINTSSPQARLEVSGGEVRFPPGANAGGLTHFNFVGDGKNYIRGTTILADNGGSVGIGTTAPSSRLHVNGGDVRVSGGSFIDDGVTLNAPDYVFEPNYKLMPLEELRKFVAQEKHLPNVPNAREVKEQGLNLGQFQMRLLEKIEELTLYALSQQEQIGSLHKENSNLKERLEALEGALQQQH
jgi:hypothetical protein